MGISPRLRWQQERELLGTDPFLAKMLRAEAISGHRCDNDLTDASKLVNAIDLLRFALQDYGQREGATAALDLINKIVRNAVCHRMAAPFSNYLFPE